ncbi:hypothetical protein ACFXNX_30620 [Streptomyces antimycoticus]|uniref:hypothetical protein n=1 Tax=Streptomyces antimycoticus TaxID=68175 RepID=UPI00367AE8C5
MLSAVNDDGTTVNGSSLIEEIVRDGVRRMLTATLDAEVNAYIAELTDQRDEIGRQLVVRDGYHQPGRSPPRPGRWSGHGWGRSSLL